MLQLPQPTNFDATIQKPNQPLIATGNSNVGCMIRIHPFQLENRLIRLNQSKFIIGRDPACDIVCDDGSISRNHAIVRRTKDGFTIEDCQSTNGTFVDGVKVQNILLASGSQIQVGNHIFKFMSGDSIETQYYETAYNLMTQDGLTGVYNKRFLTDAVSREFSRAAKYGRPFCVIMMDIDYFKKFNDTHGHLAGDDVLKEFANRLRSQCTDDHTLGRFGGEEFAVLLVETDLASAVEFAEKLRSVIIASPFECCAGSLKVTASFGVAQFELSSQSNYCDLINLADQRLYVAKQNGRDQVCG